jgi:hypothetical protein
MVLRSIESLITDEYSRAPANSKHTLIAHGCNVFPGLNAGEKSLHRYGGIWESTAVLYLKISRL